MGRRPTVRDAASSPCGERCRSSLDLSFLSVSWRDRTALRQADPAKTALHHRAMIGWAVATWFSALSLAVAVSALALTLMTRVSSSKAKLIVDVQLIDRPPVVNHHRALPCVRSRGR